MSGITAVFCISWLVTLKFASYWRQVGGFLHLAALILLDACANVRPFLGFQRGYQKLVLFICQILSILIQANSIRDLYLRCLTPLSTILYYIIGITPVISAGQKATPSIRRENDLNSNLRSTYPITVSSASKSSTVGSSICTTENNISASTGGHALLVARNNMITINKVVVLFCVILSYQI
jgi:hypothetical protein